jgi:adenosine deaminase
MRLPYSLTDDVGNTYDVEDERGWFRFQRTYDAARNCVRGEADMRRIVREAALADGAEGSRWLELQVDPTTYAPFVGGITPALEIVLDEAGAVSELPGAAQVGIMVAASRMRHPLEARTLARLAARYAGEGPGTVVAFGLSNDERRGVTSDFAPAFRIARGAGLALAPHAGELLGPAAVEETVQAIAPDRLGHGVRCVEDPRVLERVVADGMSRSGSMTPTTRCRCWSCSRRAPRWRWALTIRSSSGVGSSTNTRSHAKSMNSTTTSSPAWRGCR